MLREVGPRTDEVVRQRVFEKCLDAAATSPYARRVTKWLLGGPGSGARVAAVAGARARAVVVGQLLFAYPLAVSQGGGGAWLARRLACLLGFARFLASWRAGWRADWRQS